MKRLMALVLPASVMGAALGAGYYAQKAGLIPDAVWHYLWPALVALLYLGLAIGLAMVRAMKWVWPFIVGFIVQAFGLLLLAGKTIRYPIELLWYSLGAAGVAVLLVLLIWLVAYLRARRIERLIAHGVGGVSGDEQKLQQIRKDMLDALARLRRAGRGRNAIYELPWFLVIGRSQAGKTVAIKNSDLGLPVRKDWVKGDGGTYTCDWFFTNDVVFLDTPGRWVTEGSGEEGQQCWAQLVRLLKKFRGRRPLDGLIVVVPADDLLTKSDEELRSQAGNIREVMDVLFEELSFRFPVYLLVSKCDLVQGFVDFFRGLPPQRRHEILGWSNADPNRGVPARLIAKGFRSAIWRLEQYRLEMLARIARRTQARKLFFFTEEFKRLEAPMRVFADSLFAEDQYHETPVFRGFYFTSGTQGEGTPMGQAMAQLARNLGVRTGSAPAEEEEPRRSYFLRDLFRVLMVGDEGLVSRTALHWWRRRRDTMFAVFLPACAAGLFLVMSSCSYLLNNGIYEEIRTDVPRIVDRLRKAPPVPEGTDIINVLRDTEKLRDYHEKLNGFTLMRSFGMRKPGPLENQMFQVFRNEFERSILRPTLRGAQVFVVDPNQTCTARTDVFYGVAWLRQGGLEWNKKDLEGFNKVWSLPSGEMLDEARNLLRDQFSYLKENSSPDEPLLPGISLKAMAESVRESCAGQGAASALVDYLKFQTECPEPYSPSQITRCYKLLRRLTDAHEEDYQRLENQLRWLEDGLASIAESESEAAPAQKAVSEISLKPESSGCVASFSEKQLAALKTYTAQDEADINACRQRYDAAPSGKKRRVVVESLRQQREARKEQETKLTRGLADYIVTCSSALPGGIQLDVNLPVEMSEAYRGIACQGLNIVPPQPGPILPPSPPGLKPPTPLPVEEHVPVRSSQLDWFEGPKRPAKAYTADAWQTKLKQWKDDLEDIEALPSGQKDFEIGELRDEIRSYGKRYAIVWKEYLGSLELRHPKTLVPAWLEGLAATAEHEKLLREASKAVQAADSAIGDPFEVFAGELEPLERVKSFTDERLPGYKTGLENLAKDLNACAVSNAAWLAFRRDVMEQKPTNSLVALEKWVNDNVAQIAEGSLRDLFMQPVLEARNYIQSDDIAQSQWSSLQELYGSVHGRFPFTNSPDARMVDPQDFKSLLGLQSGTVAAFLGLANQLDLSENARRWLGDAGELSRILFVEKSDQPKPLRVRVTYDGEEFQPPKLAEDFLLQEIRIKLGEEEQGIEPALLKSKPFDLILFGDDACRFSAIKVKVAQEKGMVGKMFGSNLKEGELKEFAPSIGDWAPLKLLAAGAKDPAGPAPLTLSYAFEIPYKRNEPGKLVLHLKVEGEGLSRLLALMTNGLEAPPDYALPE